MKQTVTAFRRVHNRRFSNPVAAVVSRPVDFGTVRAWDIYLPEIANQLRSMKRLWVGKGLDGLLKRREAEALMVEGCVG